MESLLPLSPRTSKCTFRNCANTGVRWDRCATVKYAYYVNGVGPYRVYYILSSMSSRGGKVSLLPSLPFHFPPISSFRRRADPPVDGVRGITPENFLKFSMRFGTFWCIFLQRICGSPVSIFVNFLSALRGIGGCPLPLKTRHWGKQLSEVFSEPQVCTKIVFILPLAWWAHHTLPNPLISAMLCFLNVVYDLFLCPLYATLVSVPRRFFLLHYWMLDDVYSSSRVQCLSAVLSISAVLHYYCTYV